MDLPSFSCSASNQLGLEAAVEATLEFLNKAVKPVLVGGPKLRVAKAQKAFVELADASGYPVAVMPSAKGLVPEHHPHFIGTYWGAVSSSFVGEIVESADAYVFVGPIFNDYSSVGYSLLIKKEKAIIVQPNRVTIANGPSFGWVFMADFLSALAKKLKHNSTALENYHRIFVPPGIPLRSEKGEALRVNVLFKHIQVSDKNRYKKLLFFLFFFFCPRLLRSMKGMLIQTIVFSLKRVLLVKCLIWVGTNGLVYICLACLPSFFFPHY